MLSITNSKIKSFKETDFEGFCKNHLDDLFEFVVDKEMIDDFKDLGKTISDDWNADTVLVNEENYTSLIKTEEKKHVILIVDTIEKLFDIFSSVLDFSYRIDLKIDNYDREVFKEQVDKISSLLLNKEVLVPLLNGFLLKEEKFDGFGENKLFVANNNIYYHPDFCYNDFGVGKISSIEDFDKIDKELVFHFTRPHLLCIACNCFYCDRNIYKNKIRTGEYKTPSTYSCATNTIFSNASKKLFNSMVGEEAFEEEDLDIIKISKDKIEADAIYGKVKNNTVLANKIKKMDFRDRLFS